VNLGDGDVDWEAVREAFREIGYAGSAITELKGGDENLPPGRKPARGPAGPGPRLSRAEGQEYRHPLTGGRKRPDRAEAFKSWKILDTSS